MDTDHQPEENPTLEISDVAIDLIVDAEVSGEGYYAKHYAHFDWPGGASGPTVGIGYDCGYCTPAEIDDDWHNILDPRDIAILKEASAHRGQAARLWVRNNRGRVTVMYDQAMSQFHTREIPKWIARVSIALPNCEKLSPDSLGALVSLAYNRGENGFHLSGDRFREMREIHSCMEDERFDEIPELLESMKRIWPTMKGLRDRRQREADLFRSGLVRV